MRVVLDANVLIAAVATRGLCESILEMCLESHRLLLCEELLEETEEKLVQKKSSFSNSMSPSRSWRNIFRCCEIIRSNIIRRRYPLMRAAIQTTS